MTKKEFLRHFWCKMVVYLCTGHKGSKNCCPRTVRGSPLYTCKLGGGQGWHKSQRIFESKVSRTLRG